jgi:ABC-type multidrug transport system permease subunit
MDKGIEIGAIFLVVAIVVIGVGYYYFTKKIPKE